MNPKRLLAHFAHVLDRPEALIRVRQVVIELGLRGKLVPQDPEERSLTEELPLAQARVAAKAAETGRMRWRPSASISEKELPEERPAGWLPVRINDTGLYVNGLAFKPTDWQSSGTPIIRIQNLTNPSKELNYAAGAFPDAVMVKPGDILVSWSATLDAFVWERDPGVLNQHIFRVIPDENLSDPRFLHLVLRRAVAELAASDHAHGLAMMHINRGPFLAHVVLLPPVAEQRRIVTKIDDLMALCDRLKVALIEREKVRTRLLEALLNEALGGVLAAEAA